MEKKETSGIHRILKLTSKKFLLTVTVVLMFFSVFAQQPQKPQIDSISIIDEHPFITWFPNNDNTEEYIIIRKEGNSISVEIATVPGNSSTFYHDFEVMACDKWYGYNVVASDEGQPDSRWSDTLRTILLYQPQLNICENYISLHWTDYVNMYSSLDGYQVWVSENGGNYYLVTQTPPNVKSYNHTSLSPNTLYTYKIIAVNEDGSRTSSSCEVSITSKTYRKPTFSNILFASVENNDHVAISWETDPVAFVSNYVLKRSDGIDFDIPGGSVTDFSDTSADFTSRSYDYSLEVYDSCGFQALTSTNIGRTILLGWQPGPANLQIELLWNAYADWANGVQHYNIYRKTDGPFVLLYTTGAGDTSWIDDVSQLTDLEGVFIYYVEAVENSSTPLTSKSNQIVVELETKVLVPNAFIPEGLSPDNEFKPSLTFVDKNSYELLIFNKWGQMIFSTSDSDEGWDGKFNGEYVPADAYVYRIRVKSPDGRDFQTQGTVTVIR